MRYFFFWVTFNASARIALDCRIRLKTQYGSVRVKIGLTEQVKKTLLHGSGK